MVAASDLYGTSPIKLRRTKAEIETIMAALYRILEAVHPMSVRQCFYQLVFQSIIAKTEAEYKTTVCRLLATMRRSREIPFGWIADSTRWMRKPRSYNSIEDALQETAATYRRALWREQDAYVEVWLEKDALAGVLVPVTARWDVPLMVTRGYPSLSYLYEAAETIAHCGKPAYLYYFGDYDPTGVDIPRKVAEDLRAFAPDAEIHFERVAVTANQITAWDLPLRPTKRSDSRSKGWEGGSVEVDAIPPTSLRALVEQCITRHIDQGVLDRTLEIEAAERETAERYLLWEHPPQRRDVPSGPPDMPLPSSCPTCGATSLRRPRQGRANSKVWAVCSNGHVIWWPEKAVP